MMLLDNLDDGEFQDLIRRIEDLERGTPLNNASIGRNGLDVYDGGVIRIQNGGLSITGTAEVIGKLIGSGILAWVGDVAFSGDVDLIGPTTISGLLDIIGNTKVVGDFTLEGLLRILGASTLEDDLTVKNGGKIIVPGAEPMTIGPVEGGNAGISFTSGGRVLAGTGGILLLGVGGLARIAASGGAASMSVGLKGVTVSETQTTVQGDISASGDVGGASKSFWIDHPTKPGKQLRHGSLEGPEHGVFYRGVVSFGADGEATFALPSYFTALVFPEDQPTVQVTAIGRPFLTGAEHVSGGAVVVYGEANREAHVVVFAARGSFDVEPDFVDQSSGITPSLNDSFAAASPIPS